MKLEGKIIDFLGDSITEGVGVTDIENCRYDNVIKRKCNLKAAYNYGIGGTRLAHQSVPSEKPRHDLCFCGRAYDLNKDADIIVVYGGVNDYLHGDAPIGTMDDTTPATFCGAVDWLMNLLKTEYADKTIVFMTPAHCYYQGIHDDRPTNRPCKRDDALPLVEYVKIIEERAKKHNIPVLNLYEKLGINPNIEEHWQKYTVDGLHFNDAGQAFIAERLIEFLEAL